MNRRAIVAATAVIAGIAATVVITGIASEAVCCTFYGIHKYQ